jgi:SAM-dependent methyltransferase
MDAMLPAGLAAPPDLPALARAVAARYAGTSAAARFARGYVAGKLRHDPATAMVLALAVARGGFGRVLDLGCGRGQLGLALLVAGGAEAVTGLDLDAAKVAEAQAAAAGLPAARFAVADLATAGLPPCDTVLLVDVLYRMPEPAQRDLLARAAAAARRRVVIRAFDPGLGWRSRVGMGMERLGRAVRGDAAALRPLAPAALAALLEAQGFAASVTPCWGRTPLPNVLLLAERIQA